jgi:antitoxin component YwqK of YwqJK toxin-antitoxin module
MKNIYLTIVATTLTTLQLSAQVVDNSKAPESKKDTLYSAAKDTMTIRVSEKVSKKVLYEDFYVNRKMIGLRNYYYAPNGLSYGYVNIDRRAVKHRLDYQKEFYKNGVLKIEAQMQKGKFSGKYTSYYPSGKLQCDGHYKHDKRDSMQTVYFENGKTSAINNYVAGKKEGKETIYHENGQIWSEKMYVADNIILILSNNDANVQPLDKGTFNAGNGTVFYYTEQGALSEIDYYANGKFVKTEKKIKQ